ncbi:MAG: hypothetical protein A2958_02105 [Candidatus Levybacteria bacterium RIFCSPLOWO2_01_FULL_38_13]|nr:MAG: hypothetical protein A2629_02860 [Candidatus Levybacteria bacterium RIFCSPHIGHO2_01_FULL_41_15]OGH35744.1 MAG: hypothetical protein A2958_02105 [Candidatus Levybacteria bacterium RIFCSPLOWO2_01_FULL_38_13]
MEFTSNYKKHTSKNLIQKFLINNFYNNFISLIKNLDIKSILDVGCGEGFTLNKFYENKIGEKLEGIDFQKNSIEIGKKLHPYLALKQGNIYNLEYKNDSFDLVIATEVLEHLGDPRRGLKELVRVSKKYLLLSVPNEPFFMIANFSRGKNLSRWGNDIEHIQHWSAKGFAQFIIHNSELRIKTKRHPFPWTILFLEK